MTEMCIVLLILCEWSVRAYLLSLRFGWRHRNCHNEGWWHHSRGILFNKEFTPCENPYLFYVSNCYFACLQINVTGFKGLQGFYNYTIPTISIVGIVGNIFCLWVLSHKRYYQWNKLFLRLEICRDSSCEGYKFSGHIFSYMRGRLHCRLSRESY